MNNTCHTIMLPDKSREAFSLGVIPFVFPGVPRVGCLFSTIIKGNMALSPSMEDEEKAKVIENRKSMQDMGSLTGWVELNQMHGDHVVLNPEPTPLDEPSSLEGDGACTEHSRLGLVIKTADCQPILMTNLAGSAVAALHVGWRGNALDFPATGLQRFCEAYGILPADVLAVRGPSLGPSAAEFTNFTEEWPPEFLPWFYPESRTMDLWALTRHQLVHAGMRPEHIFSLDFCTHSLPELFFSYRRGHAGRQVSMVWLR